MSMITRRELAEVIGERTLHVSDRAELARQVAEYLAEERKPMDLNSLMRDVMQYRIEHGIIEAMAVSAHQLPEEVIKDVEDLLKDHFPDAKKVVVDTHIDESVIGGIRIELPRENLDLSVKAKLNLFKRLVAEERN
jgi:F0F1-type ATP synthase delta subunit